MKIGEEFLEAGYDVELGIVSNGRNVFDRIVEKVYSVEKAV